MRSVRTPKHLGNRKIVRKTHPSEKASAPAQFSSFERAVAVPYAWQRIRYRFIAIHPEHNSFVFCCCWVGWAAVIHVSVCACGGVLCCVRITPYRMWLYDYHWLNIANSPAISFRIQYMILLLVSCCCRYYRTQIWMVTLIGCEGTCKNVFMHILAVTSFEPIEMFLISPSSDTNEKLCGLCHPPQAKSETIKTMLLSLSLSLSIHHIHKHQNWHNTHTTHTRTHIVSTCPFSLRLAIDGYDEGTWEKLRRPSRVAWRVR